VLEEMKVRISDIDNCYLDALNDEEAQLKKIIKGKRTEFEKE
jgi:hypothetical protein